MLSLCVFFYHMGMTPFRMRLFVVAFLALAAATSINAIYMQEAPRRTAAAVSGATPAKDAAGRPAAATAALPGDEVPAAGIGQPAGAAAAREDARQQPEPLPDPHPRVKSIQRELSSRGYHPGRQDGVLAPETRAAILAYEFDEHMPLTGEATEDVLKALIFAKAAGRTRIGASDRFEHRREIVEQVQHMLAQLGYTAGPVDGRLDARMREAIRRFETDRRLKPTGRLSERVLLEMVIVSGKPFTAAG
jgi:peptidoglycan hydrolase-like protein with peptidoglycan-binding domain